MAPAVAGVIVATLGPGSGFALEAAVLTVTAVCLAAAWLPAARSKPAAGPNVLSQVRTGWQEFARLRWLWLLTLQWTVFSLLILAPVVVLGHTIAERSLGGAAAWGVISSSLALGAVAGQFAAAAVTGTAMGVQGVIFQTVVQRTVPAAVLARVSAFDLLGRS